MRVYASKYLGHGIRVGVSENIGPRRRPPTVGPLATPVQPIPRVPAPPITRWLTVASIATFVLGLMFPPMLLIAVPLLVGLLVALIRWLQAQVRVQRAATTALAGRSR